ncbi:MAG TPA: tRNA uracil 4-sulfurtransferase ThiI [Terriglobia bacterium]|nr:tRNA uracil 4-sulfurtransferase ThiI [Terriglobia bacterium]
MDRFFVIHYNELGLKKGNRDYFENALCANIMAVLQDCRAERAKRISGRVLLPLKAEAAEADIAEIKKRLGRVFGIAYFGEAWASPQAVENLETNAWTLIEGRAFKSFRIDTRRGDKSFPHTSVEINQRVGAYVKERSGARVDLENADLTCWIEVVEKYAFIYVERLPGPGGLPVGTSGKVVVLLSGGIDSPVAAWKMIKRGCTPVFVHFHSFPYTNKESQEKAKQIAQLLAHYSLRAKIYLVPFAEVQRHIMVDTPLETRVILYRRYMLRLAEQIAWREKARVMVTGDSVGQVASQTVENIDVISRAVLMPILRPLIGDDKIEIVEVAKRIGTYDISIQPDQDCCSLFVPKHPETKANLSEIEKSEARLDVAEAMKAATDASEVLLKYPSYATGAVRQL